MRYIITQKTLNEAWTQEMPSDPDQLRRYWARLLHDFGPVALSFLANKRLWKAAPHAQLGHTYKPLEKLTLGLGECRILFGFPQTQKTVSNVQNGVFGLRQDGFVLTCRWRSDVAEHSRTIPHNLVLLADKVREQFGIPEFYLWPADCFSQTDFSDSALTGGDSIRNIGSAWASLALGLLLVKRQVVPSKNVFASIQYDFTNRKIASVDLIKQKISVIADFAPSTFFVTPEQSNEAQKALAELIAEEEDDQRREFLTHIEILEPQGSDPFSMVRAMAFTDLNTLAMEKRVRELVDLEQQAIRERRINEAFEYHQDRIQLEKTLAIPVLSAREEIITSFYRRSCNVKISEHEVSSDVNHAVTLPEGMTHVSYSPSGKQWIEWYSKPVLNTDTCRFDDKDAAIWLSNELGNKERLELPLTVPFQADWNFSETQITISGRPNDSVKLVLFHLKTKSFIMIDDFGGSVPLCITEMYFSPDGHYLFVKGVNGNVFVYETGDGNRIGGPFRVNGDCKGNPWFVSPVGCVFLCDNVLHLFHITERKLYTLIKFAAIPDRVFFHEGYCSTVIGEYVWIFDGNTGYLAAPLFNVGPVETIRLESNHTVIFTKNGKEETWRWQNPYEDSRMIPTNARQIHSIDLSPSGSIWLLHDDKKLTIIDPNGENRETFSNVVYMWSKTGSFLVNDRSYRHPQVWNISGEKRFCNFELPFAGRIQSDESGKYLLLSSTIGFDSTASSLFHSGFAFGRNQFPAKTTVCYNLQTDVEIWRYSFADRPEPMVFTDDGQYTIISATGVSLFFNNETGQLTENTEIISAFTMKRTPASPVENGYYQSERIVCEYYDTHRNWFWLATVSGRVFTLECETLNPTIVVFQFNMPVQVIKVTKDKYIIGLIDNIIIGKFI